MLATQSFKSVQYSTIRTFATLTVTKQAVRSISTAKPGVMSTAQSRLSSPLPRGTIDCHMHIIPPDFDKFPLASTAQYKPFPHTLDDATEFYTKTSGLNIDTPRCVLTQVSIYGKDNSALLSGVAELGINGRGVIECDPNHLSVDQMNVWWSQGVRGVRLNFVSIGRSIDKHELKSLLESYVQKLAQWKHPEEETKKWVVEMYLPFKSIPALRQVLPEVKNASSVRFVVDHFGDLKFKTNSPDFKAGDDPYTIAGFQDLIQLLTEDHMPEVFLKTSAPYRMDASSTQDVNLALLDTIGSELITKAEDRVMWASDWPHTRFEKIDSVPFVEACYSWCGPGEIGQRRREKLFRDNSAKLWDM